MGTLTAPDAQETRLLWAPLSTERPIEEGAKRSKPVDGHRVHEFFEDVLSTRDLDCSTSVSMESVSDAKFQHSRVAKRVKDWLRSINEPLLYMDYPPSSLRRGTSISGQIARLCRELDLPLVAHRFPDSSADLADSNQKDVLSHADLGPVTPNIGIRFRSGSTLAGSLGAYP